MRNYKKLKEIEKKEINLIEKNEKTEKKIKSI